MDSAKTRPAKLQLNIRSSPKQGFFGFNRLPGPPAQATQAVFEVPRIRKRASRTHPVAHWMQSKELRWQTSPVEPAHISL